jgi:hypothetical protein
MQLSCSEAGLIFAVAAVIILPVQKNAIAGDSGHYNMALSDSLLSFPGDSAQVQNQVQFTADFTYDGMHDVA